MKNIEYTEYCNYRGYNRIFNTVFATTIAIIVSVVIGLIATHAGIIRSDWAVPAIILLASIPVVVCIKEYNKYEGVIAYHYHLQDVYHGLIDRRFIDDDYAKTHNIYSWKEYFSENRPDGRWNYHVDTKYMERLTNARNNILAGIAKEYGENCSRINRDINNSKEARANLERRLTQKKALLSETEARLAKTSPGAMQYHLYCRRKSQLANIEEIHNEILAQTQTIDALEDEIKRYSIAFYAEKSCVERDYKIRSDHYARIATKKIQKNGLKYEIGTLKVPEYWINNPMKGI